MITVFKTIRSLPSTTVSFLSPRSRISNKVTGLSFATASNQQKMDKNKKPENPNEKTGDVMSHSFGEGYATRSDEEGFGGTYGGNQTFQRDNDKEVHENHPDYDKTQGSEAKEKEKARNQT